MTTHLCNNCCSLTVAVVSWPGPNSKSYTSTFPTLKYPSKAKKTCVCSKAAKLFSDMNPWGVNHITWWLHATDMIPGTPRPTIYKWLLQWDDSKSLDRKWLQITKTSIYKWLALGFLYTEVMSPILNGKKEIKNQRTGTPKSRTRWFLNGFQKRNKKWRKLQNQWFLDDVSPSFLFWPEDSIYNDLSTNQPTNQPPTYSLQKQQVFWSGFFAKEVDLVTTKLNHTKFWSLRKPYAVNFGCASSMLGKSKM